MGKHSSLLRVVVPCKPFLDSIVFAGMAGPYPSETPLTGPERVGRDKHSSLLQVLVPFLDSTQVALPTNNRLGWKGLEGTNTLAYNDHS